MVEVDKMEMYIRTVFEKRLKDDFNRPLDISNAMDDLTNVLKGNTFQYEEFNYEYIGETAVPFAISIILARKNPKLNKSELAALQKQVFSQITRFHKFINDEIHLKQFVVGPFFADTFNLLIGVIFSHFGIHAVAQFIEPTVNFMVSMEVDGVGAKHGEQNNPVGTLIQLLSREEGGMNVEANPADKMWAVKIKAKLNSNSTVFTHTRMAQSKQRGKNDAAHDIVNYLEKNPDVVEQLKLPATSAEEFVLPIDPNDYCMPTPSAAPPATPQVTAEWPNNSDHHRFHISAGNSEEDIMRLSELLVSTESNDEAPAKKRSRFNTFFAPQTEQDPTVTYIKKEEVFSPFNQGPQDTNFNERVISFFRQVFEKNRSVLASVRLNPGQSKTIFLSLVVAQKDVVHVDVKVDQAGNSHEPLFQAEVTLKSKLKPNVFLKAQGLAQKKRDAEQTAFKKIVEMILS